MGIIKNNKLDHDDSGYERKIKIQAVPLKARYLRAFLFPDEHISLYGLADRLEFYNDASSRELFFIGTMQYYLSENKLI